MRAIAEAREAAGITQRGLSEILKRKHNFVNTIERGQRIPNALELIEIATAIGVLASDLMIKVEQSTK